MWEMYHTPASLSDALTLLAEDSAKTRIIAGGTDILIELERSANTPKLIDITRIPDLDTITLGEDGLVHIGPLVTHNHVVGSALLRERALPLVQASWSEAAPQIRNRATVAGNLITASPANDTITPLRALDAQVTLASAAGERLVSLAEFYTGARQTVMRADEILTDISFRPLAPTERSTFIKLGLRRAQAISVINVAVVVRVDGSTVREARIALGSVAPTIVRAAEAEAYLVGQALTPDVIAQAAAVAVRAAKPIDDLRGPASYRREMVKVLIGRALRAAAEGRDDLPAAPPMLWGAQQARVVEPLEGGFTHEEDTPVETTINGERVTAHGGTRKTLLRFLREDAGLIGTKEGCSEGECGACTVFLDGAAVMACMVAAPRAHHAQITTIEGLADGGLHPVQQGFVEAGAVQCGYCTPGFVMAGAKLLEERPQATEWEIQQSITGNLCRCTGYYTIVDAIKRAQEENHEQQS